MHPWLHRSVVLLACALPAGPAAAQESPSFRIDRGTRGSLSGSAVLQSSSYRVSRSSLGMPSGRDPVTGTSVAASNDWTATLRPALEVRRLRFADARTLTWDLDRSLGSYRVYRGDLESIVGMPAACIGTAPNGQGFDAPEIPAAGQGQFFLVTAVDAAGVEGTAGTASGGAARLVHGACP